MIISTYDAQTGLTVDRDLTADELAKYEIDVINLEAKAKQDAKAAADKAALLAKLGITADEAALLLA